MLIDLFRASQDNDQEAMLTLLQRFHLLLKKYGRKLGYEDAEATKMLRRIWQQTLLKW